MKSAFVSFALTTIPTNVRRIDFHFNLHSIDNNSARTLKKNLFDNQKDFYSYFVPCSKYTRTHRKISHGGSHGVDVEK